MGLFDRHVGVWKGTHRVVDPQGRLLDAYEARVHCQRAGDRWLQRTERTFADGRREETAFEARFLDESRLRYDAGVVGGATQVDERVLVSRWQAPGDARADNLSLITLVDDHHRVRTVQHYEDGRLVRLTLIEEEREG